jgi:DegV family protein with EDD domain
MKIGLVTDSTCDIPAQMAAQGQIHIVPNLLVLEGQSYEDGKGLSREEFYTRLPGMKTPPTTGAASAGTFQDVYEHLLTSGCEQVLSIHAASRLTAIINSASTAAREFGGRVQVVDGEHISMGLGFQVLAASAAIAQNIEMAPLLQKLADIRQRVRVVAMLDTLEYVRRSGRVSWARARLGNLLQVKPFVEVRDGGQVHSLGEARTRLKGEQRLMEILQHMGQLERLAILHTNALDAAKRFLGSIPNHPPHEPIIVNVTTIIGVHVGPNGLGIAAVVR